MKRIVLVILLIIFAMMNVSHANRYLNGNTNYPLVISYDGSSSYLDLNSAYIKEKKIMADKSVMNLVVANYVLVDKNNKVTYIPFATKIDVDNNNKVSVYTYTPSGYMYNDNKNETSYIASMILANHIGFDRLKEEK